MAFKFVAFFALIAAASAAPQHQYYNVQPALIKYSQPAVVSHVQPIVKNIVEHEEPANYDFEYAVHDDHTGDIKEHHESAKNGAVSGFYSLIDADGYRRIVHYTADHEHGFNAEVRREPVEGHKVVKTIQPVITKVVQPAIAVQKYIAAPAPQYYSAPAPVQYAPAPAHYAPAPVHYAPAVVQPAYTKVIAQPAYTKVVTQGHSHEDNHGFLSHVSFKGPSSQYSY